jgi:hypothetical protein
MGYGKMTILGSVSSLPYKGRAVVKLDNGKRISATAFQLYLILNRNGEVNPNTLQYLN